MRGTWILGLSVALSACASPGRGVDADVERTVLSDQRGIGDCYRPQRDGASGELILGFTIEADGLVSGLELEKDTLNETKTTRCVMGRFQKLRFPVREKPRRVAYPLKFQVPPVPRS